MSVLYIRNQTTGEFEPIGTISGKPGEQGPAGADANVYTPEQYPAGWALT